MTDIAELIQWLRKEVATRYAIPESVLFGMSTVALGPPIAVLLAEYARLLNRLPEPETAQRAAPGEESPEC